MPANIPILRTLTDVLSSPKTYAEFVLAPSSISGKFRCLTPDETQVVSVLPDDTVILNPNIPEHDGEYEAAVKDGSLLAYNYKGLTTPLVFGIVVMG